MAFSWLKNALFWGSKRRAPPGAARLDFFEANADDASAPVYADLMRLGRKALSEGRLTEATGCFRDAVRMHSDDAVPYLALGFALVEQSRYAEAKPHLNRAVLLDASNADASYLLGKIALETGYLPSAIEHFNEALALNPGFEFALRDLGRALFESGFRDRAQTLIARGVKQFPTSADFRYYQGNLCVDERRFEEALECYRLGLALCPEHAQIHANLSYVQVELGHVQQAVASARCALALQPDSLPAYDNLLWALLFLPGVSASEYGTAAQEYGFRVLANVTPYTSWLGNLRGQVIAANRPRLRVGLVSGDFRIHAVGFLLEGLLPDLCNANWDLLAYSMNPQDDGLTARIKGYFARWTPITGLSDAQAAQKIHSDRVDILIDLSGHSARNRLPVFAWKPAPVQISWLGYLASTGVPGMDYVLADPVSAPNASHEQFTEQVWTLPETFNCFARPPEDPRLMLVPPPAVRNGHITFGSFQRMNKINDVALRLWARILLACPAAVLHLQNAQLGHLAARTRLLDKLGDLGISASRVRLTGETPQREDYLAAYANVDIILDTCPYPGVTTTGEALWMGVPTVSLGGGTLLQRIGASLLTCAGLSEWVAWSEEEYVALAVRQSQDVDALAQLRAALRQRVAATPLFDTGRFVSQFEAALFAIWHTGRRGT